MYTLCTLIPPYSIAGLSMKKSALRQTNENEDMVVQINRGRHNQVQSASTVNTVWPVIPPN